MTRTLRREAIKTIEDILIPALSDNPQTQEAIDYARELSAKCVDAMLEISGIAKRFDLEQADPSWSILAGEKITQKQLDKQKGITDFEEMIEKQFLRFPLKWAGFRGTEQDGFRRFLQAPEQTGQPLERFVDWWLQDEWNREHPPSNLNKIMQKWPGAFVVSTQPKHSEGRAFYG